MPFWLYTLGTAVPASDEIGEIKIPFTSILSALALIVIPIAIGFLVQVKLSRVAKIIRKCLKVGFIVKAYSLCFSVLAKILLLSIFFLCEFGID